jgi:predicted nucleic acid-binding protein
VSATFVLDCSVAISWAFPEECTPACVAVLERLETERAMVPALWFLEITNVLALSERKKRLGSAKSQEFITMLRRFQITVDEEAERRAFEHLLPLCRTHRLTSYDAAYLDLALRRSLPIATFDTDLKKAARATGVQLLGA